MHSEQMNLLDLLRLALMLSCRSHELRFSSFFPLILEMPNENAFACFEIVFKFL